MPEKNKEYYLVVLNTLCYFLIFQLMLLSSSPILAATVGNQKQHHHEMQESSSGPNETLYNDNPENSRPNIIFANPISVLDTRKLQSMLLNRRRTQEILVLNSIEEDFSFELGVGVEEWKHVVHKGHEYFIGRRETDVLIVSKDADEYKEIFVVDIGYRINCLETYSYWNFAEQQQEALILITVEGKLLWYRAFEEIKLYWMWEVSHNITGLTYFTINGQDYLIVITAPQTALTIYHFEMPKQEFWLAQHLELPSPINDVCVLNTGRDVILAIPQNNTAVIYTFNPHESAYNHLHFKFKKYIPADAISTIAGFKMGGHSYLALSGLQPQILLYQQGDFISKTILGTNFGLVDLFLPLPISTYRDDLLLLVQHRVHFSTHMLTVVETLLWNGETFETNIPVPCHMGEHEIYGVSCILDMHREAGIKGAYQISRGKNVSLIVPRHEAESGLFRFHTELLPKNSDLIDLQNIFDFLKKWVKEQYDLVDQAEAFLQMSDEELQNIQPDFSDVETLETPQFTFSGEVAEVYVNGYQWSKEDSNMEMDWVVQNLNELHRFVKSGRHRRNLLNEEEVYHESLEIDSLTVDELEVATVNSLPFYIQNGDLCFEGGQVEFEELEENPQDIEYLVKRKTDVENFVIDGDMRFEMINGMKWSDLKENLVFRTLEHDFEELEVEGEIIVETELNIKTLNTLNFPEDYLLSSGTSSSIVNAEKHFMNTLRASSVDTDGLINGKNLSDAITLMDNQTWQGMPTFRQLEITEILELHDQTHRPKIDFLPLNPTLNESNIIEASCHFNELYVNGPVVIKGDLDDIALGVKLKDIVLKPSESLEEILITAPKTFDIVSWPKDFKLENNAINHIPTQDFVTVHTKQTLQMRSLDGYVLFYNLTLNGSFDEVKIEDIVKEVISLDKPVDLSHMELIFSADLKASNFNVLETLNDQKIANNLQTLREDLVVKSAEFHNIQALQADFLSDILGSGKLNNKELHDLVLTKPWHKPPIRGNVFLNELILEKGLQADELHGIKTEFLYEFLSQIDELPDMVLNGRIQVDQILVTGDVQLNQLNKQNFDDELQLTTIWLNRPNYLANQLTFKERLLIKGPLNVMANYRGMYLPDVIEDIVLRNPNSSIKLKGPKSFLKPVKVLQNTQAKALNGVPLENLALRIVKENHFKGSVQIKGNLWARHLRIQGNINDFNWHDIENLLYFNKQLQRYVLKDRVEFSQALFLDDLTVLGNLNDVHNLMDFFEHLIYKNNLYLLKGKNTFTGRVSIERGAYIKYLNGHDLMQLFNNLVFIHGYEPVVIRAPVVFEDHIEANEVQVKKTMELKDLNECSLREWLKNTLRVDRDHYIEDHVEFSAGSLDGNSLEVHFMNNVDLKRILTLYTPQTFNEIAKFSEIHLQGFIDSKGPVNRVDLETEYNNTLMTTGSQHVSTHLSIQTVVVLNDLIIKVPVNINKNLQDVVTLQEENIVLESPVYFQSIYSPRLITHDLVAGIDFETWFAQAVAKQDVQPQYINGNWSVKNLRVKEGPTEFHYLINGFEPEQYVAYIRAARSEDKEMCHILKEISTKVLNRTLKVKYIEELHNLKLQPHLRDFNATIRYVDFLEPPEGAMLLLVNLNCDSLMFQWDPDLNEFVYKNSFSSGPIDDIEVIPTADNQLLFATTFSGTEEAFNCSALKPVDIWSMVNNGSTISKRSTTMELANQIHISSHGNYSLWSLNNETLEEYDSATLKLKNTWQLPGKRNETGYRFVNLNEDGKLLLSNGVGIVLLDKKSTYLTEQQPVANHRPVFEILRDNNAKSILKPTSNFTQDFVFDNFKQHLERILGSLRQRLSQQVNITQLSIPETDLLDENLMTDFLLLMQELRQQNFVPAELFNISFVDLQVPENPAQVLTARVVQICWSAVKEIEEIHSYLRNNTSHDHPLCASITKCVAFLISDILKMANQEKQDQTEVLNKVIERLREFESELEEIVKASETNQQMKRQDTPIQAASFKRDSEMLSPLAETVIFKNDQFLPGYMQGEILALQVGPTSQPLNLWAVTNSQTTEGIYIYQQALQKHLYQVVNAVKPSSLQQLRLKQETFLMFIEDCCQVNILHYQGSQGFVKYAHIQSEDHVKHIKAIDLPSNSEGFRKYFLILVLEKQLKFYEFILENGNLQPVLSKLLVPLDFCD